MATEHERRHILQEVEIADLLREYSPLEMITVYSKGRMGRKNHFSFPILVNETILASELSEASFEPRQGYFHPWTEKSTSSSQGFYYSRWGQEDGVEPIIFYRDFHGLYDDKIELCEEFRMFHNLYHDIDTGKFIKVKSNGDEIEVAIITDDFCKIRLKEIRQFLAIKEMHIILQYHYINSSESSLSDLEITKKTNKFENSSYIFKLYCRDTYDMGQTNSHSLLVGKRAISPFLVENSEFGDFKKEQSKKYEDFIIGADHNGDPITHTSSPNKLANYFGGNPDAPHYLTAVSFNKDVLDKYYKQPRKYKIEHGQLTCGNLWGISIDTEHQNKVCAWLGDLGRDLPHSEQLHWKAYNTLSDSQESASFYSWQKLNNPLPPNQLDWKFKQVYSNFIFVCKKKLGWTFLRELSDQNKEELASLRIPHPCSQREFDSMVGSINKILIESIDTTKIKTTLPSVDCSGMKSIDIFAQFLLKHAGESAIQHIDFLRKLQQLRSKGIAHIKGKKYQKAIEPFQTEGRDLESVLVSILNCGTKLLEYMIENIDSIAKSTSPSKNQNTPNKKKTDTDI